MAEQIPTSSYTLKTRQAGKRFGEDHEFNDIIGLIVQRWIGPPLCFTVRVEVQKEEVCRGKVLCEVGDLVGPHCGGHECGVKEYDSILGGVDWGGGGMVEL